MKACCTAADDGINLLFNEFKFNTWEDISPAIGCRTFDVVRSYENGDCVTSMTRVCISPTGSGFTRTTPTPLQTTLSSAAQMRRERLVDFKTPLEVLKESIKPVGKAELYFYSRTNPADYRPFFFDDFDNPYASGGKNSSGDHVDCEHDCDYATVKAGECECHK